MSSANSTEIEKTEVPSPVYKFEKSLSDSISKKFSNVEIVYVKQNRIRVNVKKKKLLMLHLSFVMNFILIMLNQ